MWTSNSVHYNAAVPQPVLTAHEPDSTVNRKEALGLQDECLLKALIIHPAGPLRLVITDAAESAGAQVVSVSGGRQATIALRKTRFDMVFAAIPLAGLVESELIEHVGKFSPETEIYVVGAYEHLSRLVKCTLRGAEGFILEPAVSEQVRVAVRKARSRKRLRLLAHTDGLTALFNHTTFQHFLSQECRRSARRGYSFGLVMLDIDNFKLYNDLNGHLVGDIALIKMGKLLRENTRACDVPARYGGDEFAAILTETTLPEALARVDQIRGRVASSNFQYENSLPGRKLTASLGLAVYPEHGTTPHKMIGSADKALYCAKAKGRSRLCVFGGKAPPHPLNESNEQR